MLESKFKKQLIRKIERLYPGAIVLKNDANFMQGIPDHLILYGKRWVMFDAKQAEDSNHQPNQDYYINLLNEMSYAMMVYPQNEERFLYGLQQTFRTERRARISKPF